MQNLGLCVLGFTFAIGSLCTQAAEKLRPGQWNLTIKMNMKNGPQIPAEQLAELKELGIQVPLSGEPFLVEQCITPEQASLDKPFAISRDNNSCTIRNLNHAGNKATGEIVCSGDITGSGIFEMTLNSDTSFQGIGTVNAMSTQFGPIDQTTEVSGEWVKATCDVSENTHYY